MPSQVQSRSRTSRFDHVPPRDLRELETYTDRAILSGGSVAAPAVTMPAVPPAPRLRPGTSLATHQNKAETAQRMGLDHRIVSRWMDPARLLRLLTRKK